MILQEELERLQKKPAAGLSTSAAPLPTRIAATICYRIIHDQMKPGAPIRERLLADELEVSRTPLRDALKLLSVEKLVELTPNRGAFVVDPTADDMSDMLLVYSELDALGCRLACRMANEADFLRVEHQQARMRKAQEDGDRLEYFHANQSFHKAIIAASRSATTIEIHANLNLRLYRVRYLSILAKDEWRDRSVDHAAMVESLRARDETALLDVQKRHFNVAWRLVDEWANGETRRLA